MISHPSPSVWWRDGVIYQIYPRSFCDTSGSGVGDLDGIRQNLGHLVDLGVDALWLSPVFPSPMADFGYDVADYCDIDPLFGSLADFDRLLAEAHDLGLRVLLDWVPNHTSDQHPWFRSSRSSRRSPERDWYVWRDPAPDGGPPNNWVRAFSAAPAWTFDGHTGQYYLHLFEPEQPDLNWANPEVEAAMHETLRFWLDRGVDGFRIDVVHCIGKDPELADDPPELEGLPHCILNHRPETHPLLRRLRTLVDSYPGDRVLVGEVVLLDTALVATYYGRDDELHLAFNFRPLHGPFEAGFWRTQVEVVARELETVGAWPTWVLSNHDVRRHRTRYGSLDRARAAAVLLLTLRGTPFLFAGEELGLEDAEVPPSRAVDPGGRDGCRAPLPWEPGPLHGWAAEPWLPWPPDPEHRNAEAERGAPDSMLELYRTLIAERRSSTALRRGTLELIDTPPGALGFRRSVPGEERVMVVNLSDAPVVVSPGGRVLAGSNRALEGTTFDGRLAPCSAVLLDPGDHA